MIYDRSVPISCMIVPLAAGVDATVINVAGGAVGVGSILLALAWWRSLIR